jgi:hypothetical protein
MRILTSLQESSMNRSNLLSGISSCFGTGLLVRWTIPIRNGVEKRPKNAFTRSRKAKIKKSWNFGKAWESSMKERNIRKICERLKNLRKNETLRNKTKRFEKDMKLWERLEKEWNFEKIKKVRERIMKGARSPRETSEKEQKTRSSKAHAMRAKTWKSMHIRVLPVTPSSTFELLLLLSESTNCKNSKKETNGSRMKDKQWTKNGWCAGCKVESRRKRRR